MSVLPHFMQLHANIRNYRKNISPPLLLSLSMPASPSKVRLKQNAQKSNSAHPKSMHRKTSKNTSTRVPLGWFRKNTSYCCTVSHSQSLADSWCCTQQNTPQYGHSCRYYKTYQLHSIALHYHQQMAQCARWPKPVQTWRKNLLSTAGQFVKIIISETFRNY